MKGCFTALITPFKAGKVDFVSLENLIDFQMKEGIDGLVPCGTTGESPTLSHDEHREVVKFTIGQVRKFNQANSKTIKVLAGSGSNSTEESLCLSRDAERYGADGLLIVTPYYNKPTQAGIQAHFEKIAKSVEIEVVVYNIPGRTGVLIHPETIATMSENCQNIRSVKDATGDIDEVGRVLSRNPRLEILSGNDSMNLPIYSVGGVGCVSVLSNLFPREVKQVRSLYVEGKGEAARKIHYAYWQLGEVLFWESNPIPVKSAAKMMNLIESEEIRLPLTRASETVLDRLRILLKN